MVAALARAVFVGAGGEVRHAAGAFGDAGLALVLAADAAARFVSFLAFGHGR